jgi:hypothetical protein
VKLGVGRNGFLFIVTDRQNVICSKYKSETEAASTTTITCLNTLDG